jgi:hypothetical protein
VESDLDKEYLPIIVDPIRVCAAYTPKMGGKNSKGYTLEEFQALYQADPFYNWFGLDNPLMYAAHKAAGGMTSIYRQIGIGCETLLRRIFQDNLGLSVSDTRWSYQIPSETQKFQTLSLDGRIPLNAVQGSKAQERIHAWIEEKASELQVDPKIIASFNGIVFEIRQGYKSKDSKRQNADIRNAGSAYARAYLPCVMLLSTQIDYDIYNRYRIAGWAILTGKIGNTTALESTYMFMRDIVGYDLVAFFERNHQYLREEIEKVLEALLRTA